MTLREYEEQFHVGRYYHQSGAICVPDNAKESSQQWALFHLDDYAVSSVGAGTIWLVPRQNREAV